MLALSPLGILTMLMSCSFAVAKNVFDDRLIDAHPRTILGLSEQAAIFICSKVSLQFILFLFPCFSRVWLVARQELALEGGPPSHRIFREKVNRTIFVRRKLFDCRKVRR
jgi:hypothetical protein